MTMSIAALGPLAPGLQNEATGILQRALANLGYPLKPTGIYGEQTARFVNEFRMAHGLPQTGDVDATVAQLIDAALLKKEQEGLG